MPIRSKASVVALAGVLALAGVASGDNDPSGSNATPAAQGGQASKNNNNNNNNNNKVTAIPSLSGAGTSVKIDAARPRPRSRSAVALAPTGSATFDASTSTITFPITSGYAEIHRDTSVQPGYIQGSIAHEDSGFSLTAGSTKVELSNFVVDPGNSMLYGTVGGTPKVPLLFLDGTNVKVTTEGSDGGPAGHRGQAHRHRGRRPQQGLQRQRHQGRPAPRCRPARGPGHGDHV